MRVLVACGAAGSIAATFNAPLAGVFFAMELILRDFNTQSFGMVVLASVTASVTGRAALGNRPFLGLPPFAVDHLAQFALFAALRLLAGVVGVLFSKVLYRIEDICDGWWKGPKWQRPAVGGILLGGVLLVLPEMYGVGYPVLGNSIAGRYAVAFLLVLLIGKMVATSLTIGIGGSGGVFAPSLFIGAMLGSAYGQVLHEVMPGVAGQVGTYGLIGMGAVFAGAARAPITAVIIMFELTGEYIMILPLMAAIVLATGISHLMTGESMYTAKLRRRGVDLDAPEHAPVLATMTAGQVMEPVGESLPQDTGLLLAAVVLARAPHGQLPVTDALGAYLGVATARGAAAALSDGCHDLVPVASIVEQSQPVRSISTLESSMDALDQASGSAVPVPDDAGTTVIGWLSHQRVLTALSWAAPHPRSP